VIALTAYFNPQRHPRNLNNYLRFADSLARQRVTLLTAELCFDDDEPEVPEPLLRARGSRRWNLMFQKEPLLRELIRHLPGGHHEGVAWFDCDVLLLNDDWARMADDLLSHFEAVQLFSEAHFLDRGNCLQHKRASAAAAFRDSNPLFDNYTACHPGLAWAARADLLREHGLYDGMISGSNDTVMFRAFTRSASLQLAHRASHEWQEHANAWCKPVTQRVNGKVGCVSGAAVHLYHGPMDNRRYAERWDALREYVPARDVARQPDGLLQWSAVADDSLRARVGGFIGSSRTG